MALTPRQKRVVRVTGVVTLVILFGWEVRTCMTAEVEFELFNNASEAIERAEVELCGESRVFEGLEPRESRYGRFEVRCESHYVVHITFRSSRQMVGEGGYVCPMVEIRDRISVMDKSIAVEMR